MNKSSNKNNVDEQDENVDETDVISEQINYWNQGISLDDQKESRGGTHVSCSINSKLLSDISTLLNKVASKSDSLI